MSTFKGVVDEFPDIRIDYFRHIPGKTPPLACFLSHVHSDHLQGLESLRSPFIYCSFATRELLLRLEQYPHRMNFAKGILESRRVHYKHLNSLLKPIPLHTPTEIELGLGRIIRVTLFDANHCSGAVMFLIDDTTKAILYTGDIRAEHWWVNSLIRNPILIPYTLGERHLDKLYLDTTFAANRDLYRTFPSKAEGLAELLKKISAYPTETVFHFNAWTFGYEEVWQALASALNSKVHVDRYKMRLYSSLNSSTSSGIIAQEGAVLCGFKCGNKHQEGCLTDNELVKIHSCERGTSCIALNDSHVVSIVPIVTRTQDGSDLEEPGAGGGSGDLLQIHELDLGDTATTVELIKLCSENIADEAVRTRTLTLITQAVASESKRITLEASQSLLDSEEVPLLEVVMLLQRVAGKGVGDEEVRVTLPFTSETNPDARIRYESYRTQGLPKVIRFPYSRHSSYDELCTLVGSLKPKDVYPCTVNEKTWNWNVSMETLFGHLCSSQNFAHDRHMISLLEQGQTSTSKRQKYGLFDAGCDERQSSQITESTREVESQVTNGNTSAHTRRTRQYIGELQNNLHHHQSKKRRFSNAARYTLREDISVEYLWSDASSDAFNDGSSDNYMDQHVQGIREAFEEGLRNSPTVMTGQKQTQKPAKSPCSSIKEGISARLNTEAVANQDSGQNSIPTPPDEAPSQRTGSWSKKPSSVFAGNLVDPVIITGISSKCGDISESDDISLLEITDPTLRKETSKTADVLQCSIIMAKTWLETLAYIPSKGNSAKVFKREVQVADNRSNHERMDDEPTYKKLAGKIRRLRDILPVADEASCFFSLKTCEGDFPRSRELLARSLVALAKRPRQPLREEDDHESEETQLSLLDEAFDSQLTTKSDPFKSEDKTERRKEAYKAAQGLHGRDWASYGGISRDNSLQEEEIELG